MQAPAMRDDYMTCQVILGKAMMADNGVAMYAAASLISMHVLHIKPFFIIFNDHVAPRIPSYFNAAPMHHSPTVALSQ